MTTKHKVKAAKVKGLKKEKEEKVIMKKDPKTMKQNLKSIMAVMKTVVGNIKELKIEDIFVRYLFRT